MMVTVKPKLRAAQPEDAAFLAEMLVEAVAWRPGTPRPTASQVLASSDGHYIAGWPRHGDCGVVAELEAPIGAAWCRLLAADDPGYGFVNPETPEVTIGVLAPHRGIGVGRMLLTALMEAARANGYRAMSLSVEEDNDAGRLYEAVGFQTVGRVQNAWTMTMELD
jgi:GNAT superfamily N-acetyltransferase